MKLAKKETCVNVSSRLHKADESLKEPVRKNDFKIVQDATEEEKDKIYEAALLYCEEKVENLLPLNDLSYGSCGLDRSEKPTTKSPTQLHQVKRGGKKHQDPVRSQEVPSEFQHGI